MPLLEIVTPVLLVGALSGCRSLTPLAIIAVSAHLRYLSMPHGPPGLLGSAPAAGLLAIAAMGELVGDKLPGTPSRKLPPAFAFRLITGAVCGAALMAVSHLPVAIGAFAGAIGAIIGTLGGYEARKRLVSSLKLPDWPVALVEDFVVIVGSVFAVCVVR